MKIVLAFFIADTLLSQCENLAHRVYHEVFTGLLLNQAAVLTMFFPVLCLTLKKM